MYIQPCTTKNVVKSATLNFGSQQSDNYSSFLSKKSDDIITISSIGGSCIGLIAAKDNLKQELAPKIFHSIGFTALTLFGLTSLYFFTAEANHSKGKPRK